MKQDNFSLEVFVNDKPVYEYSHQGDTFIEGRKGSTFKLRFRNPTSKRVLVVPSVDGISTLDGNPAGPDSPGIIAEAYGTIDIPGWMVTTDKASQFVFQDRDSSYARSIDATTTNTGVIGVMVFSEVEKVTTRRITPTTTVIHKHIYTPFQYPNPLVGGPWGGSPVTWTSNTAGMTYDSVNMSAVSTSAQVEPSDQLGVGWGDAVEFKMNSTTFDKGEVVSQLVIFYDSRKNLERRGIQIERRDTLSIRPNPFPGIGCKPPAGWKG